MRKLLKCLLSFCLVIFCLVSFGQVYQEMPQYGYRANRMAFDSTLQIPTVCGVPSLKSVVSVSKKAAIAFDSCNNKLYKYNPKTLTWSEISGGGGSGTVTSITIQPPLTGDSIKTTGTIGISQADESTDGYLSFTDWNIFNNKIGAIPGLDEVLQQNEYGGNHNIILQNASGELSMNIGNEVYPYSYFNASRFQTVAKYTPTETIYECGDCDTPYNGYQKLRANTYYTNQTIILPSTSGWLVNKVNNVAALEDGSVTIPTIDTSNKFVSRLSRTPGVDSFYYYIGSNRYAIKDSVGTGGGGGGAAVSYYLNGGTAASVGTYYQMSNTAVVGTNADFSLAGNGLISQWLTDVGNPNQLQIAAGNWNFEMYMSASSNGGTPAFYVELLKYDGSTFTSIATSSAAPENIDGGTIINLYLTSLAIPQTTLLSTDRLAVRVYIVNSVGGRTITMHTQDSHLCQIITNFSSGISALNGLTATTQTFSVDSSNSTFKITSSGTNHTFNIPNASASGVTRGLISNTQYTTFNNKVGFTDTTSTIATKTNLALKVNIADTSAMLSKYVEYADTSAMLSKYLRKSDTSTLSARIDSKGYALNIGGTAATINASTTYYFGTPAQTTTNSAAIRRVYIPQSGTIKGGQIYVKTTNTTTTETWTLTVRLNNSSNTTFASLGNALTDKVFGTSSLNIAVVAGDYIEITTTTPAFVTAPGSTYIYGSIFIQ